MATRAVPWFEKTDYVRPVEFDPADRRCLRCGEMFYSSWKGHRRCPECDLNVARESTGPAICESGHSGCDY